MEDFPDTPYPGLCSLAPTCKSSPMRNPAAELITTAQAAELLGITVAWANKQAAAGRLPVAHKLPGLTGAYLFRRDEIEAEAQRRSAA